MEETFKKRLKTHTTELEEYLDALLKYTGNKEDEKKESFGRRDYTGND